MRSIEKSGKTTDDAIKAALAELKCDLGDVQIDIIDAGSPGLFGMFGRLAKVKVTIKEDDKFDMPVFSLNTEEPKKQDAPKPQKPKADKAKAEKKPAPKPEPKPQKGDAAPKADAVLDDAAPEADAAPRAPKPPREKRDHDRQKPQRPPKPQKPIDPTPVRIEARDLPELDVETLSELGKSAHDFISNVTNLMNVPVEIRIEESPEHIEIQMIGDEQGILIGRRGDTLDALQYLASLQVNKNQSKYVRVTLDTKYYRARRADALTKLAGRMASRVSKTGHRVALEPMNPYERRILHSALQGHPDVTTHSEGEEPYRRVVITANK